MLGAAIDVEIHIKLAAVLRNHKIKKHKRKNNHPYQNILQHTTKALIYKCINTIKEKLHERSR